MEAGLKIDQNLLSSRRALRSKAAEQTEKQTEIEQRFTHQKELNE